MNDEYGVLHWGIYKTRFSTRAELPELIEKCVEDWGMSHYHQPGKCWIQAEQVARGCGDDIIIGLFDYFPKRSQYRYKMVPCCVVCQKPVFRDSAGSSRQKIQELKPGKGYLLIPLELLQ